MNYIFYWKVKSLVVIVLCHLESPYKLQYNFGNKAKVIDGVENKNKFKTLEFDVFCCYYELARYTLAKFIEFFEFKGLDTHLHMNKYIY